MTPLYAAWTTVGGPRKDFAIEDNATRIKYNDLCRAYNAARVGFVNTMECFEKAVAEQDGEITEAESSWWEFGAQAALVKYREQKAGDMEPEPQDNEPKTPTVSKKRESERISFRSSTPEHNGHRPQGLWTRSMTTHDPKSQHACPDPEGWEDTSFNNYWEYSISQSRILLCFFLDEIKDDVGYPDLNTGEGRGPENPHVKRLIEIVKVDMAKLSQHDQDWCHRAYSSQSYFWLVWSDGWEDTENFTMFERAPELIGTCVEEWARKVGAIENKDDNGALQQSDDGSTREDDQRVWETEDEEDDKGDEDCVDPMSLDEDGDDGFGREMELEDEIEEADATDVVLVDAADLEEQDQ